MDKKLIIILVLFTILLIFFFVFYKIINGSNKTQIGQVNTEVQKKQITGDAIVSVVTKLF